MSGPTSSRLGALFNHFGSVTISIATETVSGGTCLTYMGLSWSTVSAGWSRIPKR